MLLETSVWHPHQVSQLELLIIISCEASQEMAASTICQALSDSTPWLTTKLLWMTPSQEKQVPFAMKSFCGKITHSTYEPAGTSDWQMLPLPVTLCSPLTAGEGVHRVITCRDNAQAWVSWCSGPRWFPLTCADTMNQAFPGLWVRQSRSCPPPPWSWDTHTSLTIGLTRNRISAQALTLLHTWQRHTQFSEVNLSQETYPSPCEIWEL